MSTESEVLLARYKQVEREPDGLNRVIGVRRLRPSEQAKLAGMTPELSGTDDIPEIDPETKEPTGRKIAMSRRIPLTIAASVCEISSSGSEVVRIPFPRTRGELDSIFDRLDAEGMDAASKAYLRLVETMQPTTTVEEAKEEAKNL